MNEYKGSTRREFLGRAALLGGAAMLGGKTIAQAFTPEPTDEEIFAATMTWADAENVKGRPVGEIMPALGEHFIGTPYVAHSLEEEGEEHLVVNLRGFDCLTFVESMFALSRSLAAGKTGFDDFRHELTTIRYRAGVISGYPSRLHYFSDWVGDNVRKGLVRNVSRHFGGTEYTKTINFMTTHRDAYKQLVLEDNLQRIRIAEERMSSAPLVHIPTAKVAGVQEYLRDGDIIGTTTQMEGMDVSHTGMVIRKDGVVRFLHAPLSGKRVVISDGSIAEYLQGIRSHTGIIVARPQEPADEQK